jgi:hypothetical protein
MLPNQGRLSDGTILRLTYFGRTGPLTVASSANLPIQKLSLMISGILRAD